MAAGTYQLIWVAQGSSGSVTLASLPQTGATSGQGIVWNGSQWAPGAVGKINALTGDVTTGTPDGSGNAAATVANVGARSAAAIAAAVDAIAGASSTSSANALAKWDGSGVLNATNITGNLSPSQIAQAGAITNQVLQWNGTVWAPGTVSGGGGSGITQLTGDVTTASGSGSQAATVAFVGSKSASAVASAVTSVAAATSSATASTLMLRDGSGNVAVNNLTGNVTGNVSGSAASITGNLPLNQLAPSGAPVGAVIAYSGSAWTVGATAATGTLAGVLVIRNSSGQVNGDITGNSATTTSYTGSVSLGQLAQGGASTNQVLTWNGSAWAPAPASGGSSGITQLTGDVTTPASSSGSTAATVAAVGGSTAAAVNTAATSVAGATATSAASNLVSRDAYGNSYKGANVYMLNGTNFTVTAAMSDTTFNAYVGSTTVTLIANPANTSYVYRFVTNGSIVTIAPPTSGNFQYLANSTTNAITHQNTTNGNAIEFTGIPGTSTYIVSRIQGNWISAGSAIGVYSAISYPATSGYVLTANGSTGGAAFAALPATGAAQYLTLANKTASYTVVAADAGKWFTITGASGQITFTLPAISAVTLGYTVYFLNSIAAATATVKVLPNSADRIYMETGTTTANTGYISTSTNRTQAQSIGLTAVSANYWAPTYGYSFDWSIT